MSSKDRHSRIVLAGNPNAGKSSLFNRLTGLHQKITNIPGTTIENREGLIRMGKDTIGITDTPGTYSFSPRSLDEQEAVKIIDASKEKQCILYVADASNFKRNLFYFSQLCMKGIPVVLALNMMDVAESKGMTIDVERMEKELGIRVFAINARSGEGVPELKKALFEEQFTSHYPFPNNFDDAQERYATIDQLLAKCLVQADPSELITSKIDAVVTHRIWGFVIFLATLFLIFQGVFVLAEYPMEWIELGFEKLSDLLHSSMADGWFKKLVINGLVAGLSGVIVFVPQIAILFFFMGLLEDTGYMARVSFIMDKLLKGIGLSGKSVVPLLSGAACAIPAIMSTRTIENWKDRLITIMVTPLMSCSARLPVYTLLISMAIPSKMVWGVLNMQGLVMLAMYVLGTVAALVAAVVFKFIIKHKVPSFFIMELPMYHKPRWSNIWMNCWHKSKSFITEAGKVILIVSMVLWFLASYGPGPEGSAFQEVSKLEESYAGKVGRVMEPAIRPIGFNWKIGIALVTSFAAREVFVGTMSTIYSVDDEEDFSQIRAKMAKDKDPDTGQKTYSLAVILSLLVFYAFAMQCISTLAVVYKETRRIKWPIIQFVYMTGLAYLASFVVYQIFK